VTLGLALYGRSFKLADPTCHVPGCSFLGTSAGGGANPGSCTQTSGVLSLAEIRVIVADNSLTPVLDPVAGVKYIWFDTDQWVSYDDEETFAIKTAYANSHW
jgi:chitinase